MRINPEAVVPRLLSKLDALAYAERSTSLLEELSPEEKRSWYEHPVTQAFRLSIEADVAGILAMWLEGAYAEGKSSDETAMMQAKARGIAQALNDTLEWIETIREGEND